MTQRENILSVLVASFLIKTVCDRSCARRHDFDNHHFVVGYWRV